MDPFDDPGTARRVVHGQQQLIMFHGYYGQYQYLPRVITCAENDQVVMFCLLFGTANPTLGADDDLEYLLGRLRAAWPDVQIHLRADSAFDVPLMFDVCERLSIDYSFGVRMNATLKTASEDLLAASVATFDQTGQPQRVFESLDYQAGSWRSPRWTIIKVEAHAQGTNRRAIVTSRPGVSFLPAGTISDSPAELLQSRKFGEFLEAAKERFDVVILDCPPVLRVTDPRIVASQVDSTILAIRVAQDTKQEARFARDLLVQNGASLVGLVLNCWDRTGRFDSQEGYGYGDYKDRYAEEPGTRAAWLVGNSDRNEDRPQRNKFHCGRFRFTPGFEAL